MKKTQIHAHHDVGKSQRQTGRELGIRSSMISRELRRNAAVGGYDPEQAQIARLRLMIVSSSAIGRMMIHGHKRSGLVTLVERRCGYLLAACLPRISAELT